MCTSCSEKPSESSLRRLLAPWRLHGDEDGIIPAKYQMKEMPTESYAERTEQNVIDSDGTLIISRATLTGGTQLTRSLAITHGRPLLHIDLSTTNAFQAARAINSWITRREIAILNVAGPRASQDRGIYEAASKLLKAVCYLAIVAVDAPDGGNNAIRLHSKRAHFPRSVAEAVDLLISKLTLRDRIQIAYMEEQDLAYLQPTLGSYLLDAFGLGSENEELLGACAAAEGNAALSEADACGIIIRKLWERLQETHILKVVK